MRERFSRFVSWLSNIEAYVLITTACICWILGVLAALVAILPGREFVLWMQITTAALFIISSVIIGRAALLLGVHRSTKRMLNTYRDCYVELEKNNKILKEAASQYEEWGLEWKSYSEALKKKYSIDVDTIIAVRAKHGEILPQEKAVLSNLVDNAVHASTIQSLLDFSKNLTNEETVFLVRVNHESASWNFEITGRSIDLDQAVHVLEGIEEKVRDLADNNSLVKKPTKIYN